MEWIPIKEKLPDSDQIILVINADLEETIPVVTRFCKKNSFFSAIHYKDSFGHTFTHWMTIPEFNEKDLIQDYK